MLIGERSVAFSYFAVMMELIIILVSLQSCSGRVSFDNASLCCAPSLECLTSAGCGAGLHVMAC